MISFLKVTAKSGKPLGSLQMKYEVWAGGQVSQNWEWIGANGTDDGGTSEWIRSDTGRVSIELTSNLYKLIVSRLFAERWNDGTFPPLMAWFTAPSPYEWNNQLEYYGTERSGNLPFGCRNNFLGQSGGNADAKDIRSGSPKLSENANSLRKNRLASSN